MYPSATDAAAFVAAASAPPASVTAASITRDVDGDAYSDADLDFSTHSVGEGAVLKVLVLLQSLRVQQRVVTSILMSSAYNAS